MRFCLGFGEERFPSWAQADPKRISHQPDLSSKPRQKVIFPPAA
jgi:hypothetical protein